MPEDCASMNNGVEIALLLKDHIHIQYIFVYVCVSIYIYMTTLSTGQ